MECSVWNALVRGFAQFGMLPEVLIDFAAVAATNCNTSELTGAPSRYRPIFCEYEQLVADSAAKRANDAKSLEDKEGEKAALEARLLKNEEEKTATMKEAMLTHEYLAEVHGDCDWLLLGLPRGRQVFVRRVSCN